MRHVVQIAILLFCVHIVVADPTPGQAALDAGDFDTARAEVTAAANSAPSPALSLTLARISLAENKLDEAEMHIDAALEQEPDNAIAHTLRGQLFGLKASRASLFRAGKLAKQSLAALETALKLDPKLEEALQGMIQFRLSAPVLFGGSIDKAKHYAERLIDLNPVSGGLELADIYRNQNNTARQRALLEQLTQSHPNDPRASLALGFIHQGERNWQQAAGRFKAAVIAARSQPEHTHTLQAARYQVGRTAVLSKTDSAAEINAGIQALSDYLSLSRFGDLPAIEWAHYRRGLLYARLDAKKEEAQQDFLNASKTDDRDLKRALKAVSF